MKDTSIDLNNKEDSIRNVFNTNQIPKYFVEELSDLIKLNQMLYPFLNEELILKIVSEGNRKKWKK